MKLLILVALVAACGAPHPRPRPTTGAIVGLVRDRDSGDTIAKADIQVRGATRKAALSNDDGMYDLDQLQPGRYELTATFAGQPITVKNIDVLAGEAIAVDLVFTLGTPDPITIDWQNLAAVAIQRYRPKHLTEQVALIEGTVNDATTKLRVAGAVVTAVPTNASATATLQTISDDRGRFKFDAVTPGVYAVSAYYSISGRGQIEVLRNNIPVAGAEAVIVPLWLELNR